MAAYPGELHLSATHGAYMELQFVFRRHGTSYPQLSFSYKQSARFSRAEKWPAARNIVDRRNEDTPFRALIRRIAVLIELRLYKIAHF
jgi:hypothetical protein